MNLEIKIDVTQHIVNGVADPKIYSITIQRNHQENSIRSARSEYDMIRRLEEKELLQIAEELPKRLKEVLKI